MSRALRSAVLLGRETLLAWWSGQSLRTGAALAYYTIFSLAPLFVLVIAVAGLAYDQEAARRHLVAQLGGLMGSDGAAAVDALIERASRREDRSAFATAIAFATILFGASGAFAQLQAALGEIWGARSAAPAGALGWLRRRLLSFGMVLLIGFLLLVSLVLAAGVAALDELASARWNGFQPALAVLNLALSLGLATLLFAAIYKVLPDVDLRWRHVWLGAAVTALLFEAGKWAIGVYLGNAAVGSMYGAAGSLVVVMVWVYYSSQILFLGAHFTRVWATRAAEPRPPA